MPNRLAESPSPYLRQHADNPVDWYPWGDEAFERARAEDKPVFLSIGYSSCHWCHVMAHESFENSAIAEVLNRDFVSVKVDREERPDVDEAYMTAVHLSSGRGGWPMSLFLAPDRRPFFAATYIPGEPRGGHPGFAEVCRQIAEAWRSRRPDVEAVADQLAAGIEQSLEQPVPRGAAAFDQAFLDRAVEATLGDYDPEYGGFGGAPKFPPHTSLEFLTSYAVETEAPTEIQNAALVATFRTLEKMCQGGLHDHVGGGFHRYSTDERWHLPHFEKMLTDNALMLSNLARAQLVTEQFMPSYANLFGSAAEGIVAWTVREMTSPEGLFYTALDADSAGEEGKYYVWRVAEVREVLGDRADAFLSAFGFDESGNFFDEATGRQTGENVLHLTEDSSPGTFDEDLERLRVARETRPRPETDDKALVAANGLMIAALAEVGMLDFAGRAADAILEAEARTGVLPHQIVNGEPSGHAFLDGFAYFADALLRLADVADAFEAEGNAIPLARSADDYRQAAARLAGEMIAQFYDENQGGLFFSGNRHEVLFGRSKPLLDQPLPSPNAIALRVLIQLGAVPRIFQTREAVMGWMERAPQATGALHTAMIALLDETVEPPVDLPVSPPPPGAVEVAMDAREIEAGSDGFGETALRLRLPDGLHVNSNAPPARWLVPTVVAVRPLESEITYPAAADDRFTGDVSIGIRVRLPDRSSGEEFEVRVSYQACTENECLRPEEKAFDCVIVRGS